MDNSGDNDYDDEGEGIQESEIGISAIKEEITGLYKMCKVLYM